MRQHELLEGSADGLSEASTLLCRDEIREVVGFQGRCGLGMVARHGVKPGTGIPDGKLLHMRLCMCVSVTICWHSL